MHWRSMPSFIEVRFYLIYVVPHLRGNYFGLVQELSMQKVKLEKEEEVSSLRMN